MDPHDIKIDATCERKKANDLIAAYQHHLEELDRDAVKLDEGKMQNGTIVKKMSPDDSFSQRIAAMHLPFPPANP